MLGRSAREKPSCDCGCEAALPNSRRCAKNKHRRCRLRPAKTTNSWPPRRHPSERPSTCCGSPQQAQGAIAMENAAEGAEQWFLLRMLLHLRLLEPCGPQAAPESKPIVILNEVKNLFPCEPKTADGLCLARRRKTNEVQSRIYLGKGYRFFVALLLRMTILPLHWSGIHFWSRPGRLALKARPPQPARAQGCRP